MLLEYAIEFAKQKNFLRITLLTDRPELRSQNFFTQHGFYESPMLPMRLLLAAARRADEVTSVRSGRAFARNRSTHSRTRRYGADAVGTSR